MPSSSSAFAATISPDAKARSIVACSGAAAGLAGLWLIAGLDIGGPWRLLAAACWCADVVFSLYRFRDATSRLAAVRVSAGGLEIRGTDGRLTAARLLTGSAVMRRLAWLRMEAADGTRYQELLLACRTDPAEWHRLHLAWQFRQTDFGQTGVA